jgi:hypothetical protein
MRCHIRCSFGPHLPAEVDSGATTCPAASDLASLLRRASTLPRVSQLRTSLPCWGGLWRFHVSHGSGLCFSEGRAPVLPRLPRPPAAMDHRNKERLSYPRHAARLTCFQGMFVRYRSACKTCMLLQCDSTVQPPTQLTTPGHGYNGNTTRQEGTTVMAMFSTA